MRLRLETTHIHADVSQTRDNHLQVTVYGDAPSAYTAKLLEAPGDVMFKIVPHGSEYHSPSPRPIKQAAFDRDEMGDPIVLFTVSDPQSLSRFTSAHINQDLGIYLDGHVIDAPRLTKPIYDRAQIWGENLSESKARFIAAVLASPLPAHVRLLSLSNVTSI